MHFQIRKTPNTGSHVPPNITINRLIRGTRRVRLICTLFKIIDAICPYHSSRFAPALSGLPPDPAPPLCLALRLAKLAALRVPTRGCAGAHRLPGLTERARSVLRGLVATVLDWRRGVGRRRRTVTRPSARALRQSGGGGAQAEEQGSAPVHRWRAGARRRQGYN
jgi:hypothetical protein